MVNNLKPNNEIKIKLNTKHVIFKMMGSNKKCTQKLETKHADILFKKKKKNWFEGINI